ncbi:hypothetical protein BDW_12360 [Bdellovibrio bacteriovorus W]|nr:hypothetical protein BDW_12360 [Bdellovibrio bacteriovorus W]
MKVPRDFFLEIREKGSPALLSELILSPAYFEYASVAGEFFRRAFEPF